MFTHSILLGLFLPTPRTNKLIFAHNKNNISSTQINENKHKQTSFNECAIILKCDIAVETDSVGREKSLNILFVDF